MARRDGYRWFQGRWRPSAAEQRVLDELTAGRTNAEIAARLGLSPETVKSHIAHLLAQTGCADRGALARWWQAQPQGHRTLIPALTALSRVTVAAVVVVGVVAALFATITLRRSVPDEAPRAAQPPLTIPAPSTPADATATPPAVFQSGSTDAAVTADSPTSVLQSAVTLLHTYYYQPLDAAELFTRAWIGAAKALTAAGVAQVPPPPDYPHELPAAAVLHHQSFPALEQLAGGVLPPRTLTAAAILELSLLRPYIYTGSAPPPVPVDFVFRVFGAVPGGSVGGGLRVSDAPPHVITSIVPGSPAAQAGLHRGEIITAINGFPIGAQHMGTATQEMKVAAALPSGVGLLRTPYVLTVQEPGGGQRDVRIAPSPATAPFEWHEIVDGDIGVIHLNSLQVWDPLSPQLRGDAEVVAQHVANVLQEFEQRDVRGWVLDLRGAFSGDPTPLFNVFVNDGPLFGASFRGRAAPIYYEASGRALPFQRPLVILVSGASGGGAEILPAGLQALGRATTVGERTVGAFGPGQMRTLADGSLLVFMTGEALFGQNEVRVNGIGFTPQLVVPGPTPAQDAAGQDPQLDAAIGVLRAQIGRR